MVIANLDSQVEKVFGLSPRERVSIHDTSDENAPSAKVATPSAQTIKAKEIEANAIEPQAINANLDDSELPVWLL